jgi:hypothetical protein
MDAKSKVFPDRADRNRDVEDGVTVSLEMVQRSDHGRESGVHPSGVDPMEFASQTGIPLDRMKAVASGDAVTLIVYGWKLVEPGTLWWVFPNVAAALAAARAMTNAVKWAIVSGPPKGAIVDIGRARASGSVLIEQSA